MSKILGVIGSPRKRGNTHILVSRILEGARDHGADVESIFLNDLNILECDGCYSCWKGKCSKHDDMKNIYPRISESDVIIFGTPVYWFGPTAIMKGFIDRFVYFTGPAHRKGVRNKTAVIAVPFGDRSYKAADLLVRSFEKSLDYLGMKLLHKVLVPGVTERGEVKNRRSVMDRCYRLGRKLAAGG